MPGTPHPASSPTPFIRVEQLTKCFGQDESRVTVLSEVTLSLYRGEICVLLGPSGSGKSTFLNLVGGLEPAEAGTIEVNGEEVTALAGRRLVAYRRRELGFVFQFYNLIPDLTVRENIEACACLVPDPLDVDELLRGLGLWGHRDKLPRQVSGGQQQRCAIGRALVKKPGLLLCDEPTGALDYETSKEVLGVLERVNREHGCTTVIVTHNDAIGRMAHRILRLRDGRLVQDVVNERPVPAAELEW
ncbi:ABC transporter ATP-binding protein [Propionibacterium australiense]|uniref:ABC transporter-like n=1 Tax=Propionibacterium australiense TaxID=119981 RepID=A0A383S4N3_9ACTN|nr:ABC transporter ATP-binding protein [Propionibacterium australiense]RLP10037.1 ATP-binding cassette domain-containing protein [Propionibacterium australiense]RLP11321.1 ATP-binding cassette domain-containing protein [Propionibacterium australiense]SYZ32955.1 ABC transporter-like [Propionibacterium australiense]VEH92359.1 Macrolide export ATP-binding/permease protein MacB [Propionibacterium australiense]